MGPADSLPHFISTLHLFPKYNAPVHSFSILQFTHCLLVTFLRSSPYPLSPPTFSPNVTLSSTLFSFLFFYSSDLLVYDLFGCKSRSSINQIYPPHPSPVSLLCNTYSDSLAATGYPKTFTPHPPSGSSSLGLEFTPMPALKPAATLLSSTTHAKKKRK